MNPALLAIVALIAASMPGAAPILVLGLLPASFIVIGLIGAVMDYMTARGVKDSLRRARDDRRRSPLPKES